MTAESQPTFNQVNLIVADMDATVAFYRRLGLDLPEAAGFEWPPGTGARHAEATTVNGVSVEFDNLAMTKLWFPDWEPDQTAAPSASRSVLNFSVPSPAAVDDLYAELTGVGHPGRQAPYDAFWGSRYAIVADPDGNHCGIMSPEDPNKKYTPGS